MTEKAIPKAEVTEKDGEISCSIEESNHIRALLGLKPLRLEGSNTAEVSVVLHQQQEREADEIRQRIESVRNRRLLNTKLVGHSIGEIQNEEESAADWVRRTKLNNDNNNEVKTKQYKEKQQQAEYNSHQLKGLRVMHDSKSLDTGSEIILTLADSNLLDIDKTTGKIRGINEEDDVLENTNIAANERRLHAQKEILRSKRPLYSGIDDDEFEENDGNFTIGKKSAILSYYDPLKKKGPALVLDATGTVAGSSKSQGNDFNYTDNEALVVGGPQRGPQSLQVTKTEGSDYYNKEEYNALFNKPKKEKKKRKIRQKNDDIDDTNDLNELFMSTADSGGPTEDRDRGSRNRNSNLLAEQSKMEEDDRRGKYNEAVKKASDKTTSAFQAAAGRAAVVVEEDDDAEMSIALARARRVALLSEKREQSMQIDSNESKDDDTGASRVRDLLQQTAQAIKHEPSQPSNENKLVFTSTTEFSALLQARMNEKARERTEATLRNVENSTSNFMATEEWDGADNHEMELEGNNDSDDMDQLQFMQQPSANRGLADALSLLRGAGDLKKKEDLVGRAKDSRGVDPSGAMAKDIVIEYRDENGRKLTQKEAYRQLCYQFHGYGPGKNKLDKRQKQAESRDKMNNSSSNAASSFMKSLTATQVNTGQAHIAIDGGANMVLQNDKNRELLQKKIKEKADKLRESK